MKDRVVKSYRDLAVWEKAMDLVTEIYMTTETPSDQGGRGKRRGVGDG